MAALTLDTSGVVTLEPPLGDGRFTWPDLNPFEQGYIEALFADIYVVGTTISVASVGHGFASLAPETLAAILKDCEKGRELYRSSLLYPPAAGRHFWISRQTGGAHLPPLTVTLGDDGKVRFA